MSVTRRPAPARLRFTADEQRHAWLPLLLDAYFVADQGVEAGIQQEELRGRTLACAKGCSHCCRSHLDIPVYPLELVGLSWYATEHIGAPLRAPLKVQLRAHEKGQPCPFLVEGVCSVHPLRPLACRHFNVFGRACGPGEDAFHTRREDVLTPREDYKHRALAATLPFYGIHEPRRQQTAMEQGALHAVARPLQSNNWQTLAQNMDAFERRAAEDADS